MIQATRKSVCAIIPAFGEARFIGTVVCGILEHVDHVIVVDDYSPDQTKTVAREAGAEVIRHFENLGKGAAIKAGLRRWRITIGFSSFWTETANMILRIFRSSWPKLQLPEHTSSLETGCGMRRECRLFDGGRISSCPGKSADYAAEKF
jgi:glycosyltransferase involved in cell wall biosynthesis